jgi:hypothetical protein
MNELKFTKKSLTNGTVYNITNPVIIQTPRVEIKSIGPSFDEFVLKILPTRASQNFFSKIHEFEESLKKLFPNQTVTSLFDRDTFKIKNNSKNFKVYFANKQFNVYDLLPGDCIIALISINVLWENMYQTISYNLRVDEILLVTKKT